MADSRTEEAHTQQSVDGKEDVSLLMILGFPILCESADRSGEANIPRNNL